MHTLVRLVDVPCLQLYVFQQTDSSGTSLTNFWMCPPVLACWLRKFVNKFYLCYVIWLHRKRAPSAVVGKQKCNLQVGSSNPCSHKKDHSLCYFQWNMWSINGCSMIRGCRRVLAVSGTSWVAGVHSLFSTLQKRIFYLFVNASGEVLPLGVEIFFLLIWLHYSLSLRLPIT